MLVKQMVIFKYRSISLISLKVFFKEMRPQWFDIEKIPYEHMWKDDSFWLPFVINNKFVKAFFLFKEDQTTIISHNLFNFDDEKEFFDSLNIQ